MSSGEYGARARPFKEQLIQRNPDGSTQGRDPRRLPKPLLERAFPRRSVLKSIRAKCLDCCCYQVGEIAKCTAIGCPLWILRMGTNPLSGRKGNPASLHNFSPKARNLQRPTRGRPTRAERHPPEKTSPRVGNSVGDTNLRRPLETPTKKPKR
jgi:hypothetical protein